MDGLTGGIQDRMRTASAPSAQQIMLAMNDWSIVILGFALLPTCNTEVEHIQSRFYFQCLHFS